MLIVSTRYGLINLLTFPDKPKKNAAPTTCRQLYLKNGCLIAMKIRSAMGCITRSDRSGSSNIDPSKIFKRFGVRAWHAPLSQIHEEPPWILERLF